jgi:hypothetical protein
MRQRWGDDLRKLVLEFRSSDLPLRTQALVQQAVKAVAERIERIDRNSILGLALLESISATAGPVAGFRQRF